MNTRTLGYWTTTGLFSAMLGLSGVLTATHQPQMAANYARLGYPAYFMTILGVAKILGVATLLAPRLPRLKEWAYAGFAINLTSAALSHLAVGDAAGVAAMPLAFLALGFGSWALRPASRTLTPSTGMRDPLPEGVAAAA